MFHRSIVAQQSPRITFRRFLQFDWSPSDDDPLPYLYEDLLVASYLIILWRSLYESSRPPSGFVDIGCGRGLLVFVLSSEGYAGYGIDLSRPPSWNLYPSPTDLRVGALDPVGLLEDGRGPFEEGSFFIGNHADELTPWIPVFAAATPGGKFLNIPCCPFEFDGRFTRLSYTLPPLSLPLLSADGLATSFFTPSTPNAHTGRFEAYQAYLAHISLRCGFVPERETIRRPATGQLGFVGRTRVWDRLHGDAGGLKERKEGEALVALEMRDIVDSVRTSWVPRSSPP